MYFQVVPCFFRGQKVCSLVSSPLATSVFLRYFTLETSVFLESFTLETSVLLGWFHTDKALDLARLLSPEELGGLNLPHSFRV